MRSLMSQRDSVKVVFDQVGTPTYALDLAKVIFKIIEENLLAKTGIYHFSNEGAISWYDFAEAIRDLSNIECDVQPCHTEEFPTKAERPRFSVLDKTKIKATFGIRIPYWRDSLTKILGSRQDKDKSDLWNQDSLLERFFERLHQQAGRN